MTSLQDRAWARTHKRRDDLLREYNSRGQSDGLSIDFVVLPPLQAYNLPVMADGAVAKKGAVMSKKSVLVAIVVAGVLMFAFANRTTSSADAAGSDCYAGDKGPDTPTICQ